MATPRAVLADVQCVARHQAARTGGIDRAGWSAIGGEAGTPGVAGALALFELERWRMDRLSWLGRGAVPETGACDLARQAESGRRIND